MVSKFFIEHPVLANVIAILMVLLGAVALYGLPVSQYPDVVPPTVQVTTRYPGASARTLMDTVALPIEQQVNGVENMLYMLSTSASDGSYSLTVTFRIGTNLDNAQILVQNRVATALSSLPKAVQSQGVAVKKRSTAPLLFVILTSPDNRYDGLYLANYATINLVDELARLPGVGEVMQFGASQYSMRIWLDPDRLKARSLNAQDVIQALQSQSQDVAAGQVGTPPAPPGVDFQYTIDVHGRFTDAAEFENVIVKTGNAGEVTRIRDIGRVELGAQSYSQAFTLDGKAGAGIGIFQTPGANALDVERAVQAKMKTLSQKFPQGVVYSTPYDTTVLVEASIEEVYKTLMEAAVLVLIVILVFLQDWRAMLVPATTVPVTDHRCVRSHVGARFRREFLDAVRDRARDRHRHRRCDHRGGGRGPQYRAGHERPRCRHPRDEHAAGAHHRHHAGADVGVSAGGFSAGTHRADLRAVRAGDCRDRAAVRHQRRDAQADPGGAVAAPAGAAGAAQCLLPRLQRGLCAARARLRRIDAPHGLALGPDDGHRADCRCAGRSGASRAYRPAFCRSRIRATFSSPCSFRMEPRWGAPRKVLDEISTIAGADPAVSHVVSIGGVSPLDDSAPLANAGVAYLVLKPWNAREDLRTVFGRVRRKLAAVDARVITLPPPPIQGIGNVGGFTMQVELRDGSADFSKLQSITARRRQRPVAERAAAGVDHVPRRWRRNCASMSIA